jgi:hypothetical protein
MAQGAQHMCSNIFILVSLEIGLWLLIIYRPFHSRRKERQGFVMIVHGFLCVLGVFAVQLFFGAAGFRSLLVP